MAGIALTVDASDLGDVGRRLNRLAAQVADMSPLMDEIGAMLVASTLDRFEKGQGPDGEAWQVSGRVSNAQGNAQTLVDSGRLRASITHVPGNNQVEVGSNVVYAAIHQMGGKTGRNHAATMPARPYLGISAADRNEIDNVINDYLAEALQ